MQVGTDGTDHEYRMLIEGRYKQLAKQRRELEAITLYMVHEASRLWLSA